MLTSSTCHTQKTLRTLWGCRRELLPAITVTASSEHSSAHLVALHEGGHQLVNGRGARQVAGVRIHLSCALGLA